MWKLDSVLGDGGPLPGLSFSDGKPIDEIRGNGHTSYRLTIEGQGFIDFTELPLPVPYPTSVPSSDSQESVVAYLDLNGQRVPYTKSPAKVELVISGHGNFSFSLPEFGTPILIGTIKPFPEISDAVVASFTERIEQGYVPYPQPPGTGKTIDEIKRLGKRFFPFLPHSFELAMAIYDWTTASFARMVLLRLFEYTKLAHENKPGPLDQSSLSQAIFDSNWPPYTPQNADYMRSFLMTPADSLPDVSRQLEEVWQQLQDFAIVGNQLLWAATLSMPRTPVLSTPLLYSGQIDMSQLQLSRFGAEFLQFAGNAGPPGEPLEVKFQEAMATFLSSGNTVTTKQVWSFSDSIDIAMHYQNGIVLIAHPPPNNSLVWDTPCYITDLSNDYGKIEKAALYNSSRTALAGFLSVSQ
ncbi:hypothetical protein OPQ81_000652 [Rhizoctonia solani]|nr:hypothetical protein OPQ81_000652 [Rhizoctonia solani]